MFYGSGNARKMRVTNLILALTLCVPVFAARRGRRPADACRSAAARGRRARTLLPAQDAAATAAKEMAVAAGQWPDPVLKLGVDNLPGERSRRVELHQGLHDDGPHRRSCRRSCRPTSGRRRAARYEREARQGARSRRSAVQANIARDTALAWIDRYYAEATVALIARADGGGGARDRGRGVRVSRRARHAGRRVRGARRAGRARARRRAKRGVASPPRSRCSRAGSDPAPMRRSPARPSSRRCRCDRARLADPARAPSADRDARAGR